jgi:GTPase SAR1 family protein
MNKHYDYIFKIVIVGSSSVGKSSILKRFADGDFNEKYISTVGVDFRFK